MLQEPDRAIEYIEEHLIDELHLGEISEHVGISDYYSRTVLFYLAGMILNEYVKGRKLPQANQDLLMGEKVTDIACKYGYGPIDGFARAFKEWNGFLPSDVAEKRISKSLPKLSFVITIKGESTMECRIEEKPAFHLAGVSRRVPMQFGGVNDAAVDLTTSTTNEQREEMYTLQNMEPHQIVSVFYEADTGFLKEEGELTHLIGVLTTEEEASDRLMKVSIEACVWVVFSNEGPFSFALQNTMA